MSVPGAILLVLYLSVYFGAWGWLAHKIMVKGEGSRVLIGLPAAWALLEYLRSILLTGFGWNLLAHTQWHWIPLIQIASLTGVWGVSFLVVMINVAIWQTMRIRVSKGRPLLTLGIAGFCLLAAIVVGEFSAPIASLEMEFKVAVVQGNIPQPEKWDDAFAEAIWKRYETLTTEAAQWKPDLMIWPETSVPGYLEEPKVFERLQRIARESKISLLVGVPASNEQEPYLFNFNAAVLLDSQGKFADRYDKVHLVPFGEYLPLEPLLGWLRRLVLMGNFSPGHHFTVFRPSSIVHHPAIDDRRLTIDEIPPFSVLICFEDLFPGLTRRFVREGARWLVVITNDAWFHRSAASVQHLQASVFRAIENRVWVVRAANTAWSGFIDPYGRRMQQVPLFEPGVAVSTLWVLPPVKQIPPGFHRPLYLRWGDWFQVFCLGLLLVSFPPSKLFIEG